VDGGPGAGQSQPAGAVSSVKDSGRLIEAFDHQRCDGELELAELPARRNLASLNNEFLVAFHLLPRSRQHIRSSAPVRWEVNITAHAVEQ